MSDALLDPSILAELQRQTFAYFLHETNPRLGLVADKTGNEGPASIAAVGLALAGYAVGHRARADLASRGGEPSARGHPVLPRRAPEHAARRHGVQGLLLSFPRHAHRQARGGASFRPSIRRCCWRGCSRRPRISTATTPAKPRSASLPETCMAEPTGTGRNGGATVSHGWSPESGFLPDRWEGYCEALLLYVLGLGSPTHPLPAESYDAWTSTYQWKEILGYEYLHAGPLFIHQLSHLWIDFRGIQDAFMRSKSIDYFENSRARAYVQRQYAIENPRQFAGYSNTSWGITASDGPGPATLTIGGKRRQFFGYQSREIPNGPDDGTLAPWAVVASLPFAPEIVLPALQNFEDLHLRTPNRYGFKATFNRTFPEKDRDTPFWISPHHLGLNQGPVLLMIENAQTGLLWRLMRSCPHIIRGLSRAGFTGGWLEGR